MKKPHILIVDDERDIRMTLEAALTAEGYRVTSAGLGETALEMINEDPPELILLDVMMPDIDGYEVCRRIKENENTNQITVLFATALRKTKNKVEGLDIGADDYITKPFDMQELMAKIRVHFRIHEYHRKMENMVDFAHKLNVLDLETIVVAITENIEHLMTADRYSIFIFDWDTGKLRLLAHNHENDEMNGMEIGIDESPFMAEALNKMDEVLETDFSRSRYKDGEQRDKYGDDFALCVPLKMGTRFLGFFNLNGNSKGFFQKLEFNFIKLMSEILSSALNNIRQLEQLRKLAVTDGLTGLFNHRSFQEKLADEFLRSQRFGQPMACLMTDIDYFKKINDTYGHPVGDSILKELALKLKERLRKIDVVARYGGEEFAILLPQTNAHAAKVLAERIRKDVEDHTFQTEKGPLKVTISLGICDTDSNSGIKDGKALLEKADEALYAAKHGGRNQAIVYEPVKSA